MHIQVKNLPDATLLHVGSEHELIIEQPTILMSFDDKKIIKLLDPGIYKFFLIENSTPNGEWGGIDYCERSFVFKTTDNINRPPHYTSSKATCDNCGDQLEQIEITRHMSFNIGNAVKYLWRFELKNGLEDLKKAKWYINDAIKQLENK